MVISDGQVRVSPFEKPPQENGKYNHHQGAGNHAQPTGVFNAAPVPKKQNGNGNYADDGAYGDMIDRQNYFGESIGAVQLKEIFIAKVVGRPTHGVRKFFQDKDQSDSRQHALDNRNGKEVGNETCTEYSQ